MQARRIRQQIDELVERIEVLRAKEDLDALRPPIDGFDVMEYLGIGPGPTVGAVLKVLLEKRIYHGPYERAEAFGDVRRWAIEQGSPDPGEPQTETAPGPS